MLIVAMEVDYRADCAVAACVGFRAWDDERAATERAVRIGGKPADYEPGKFYLRELPCLLAALRGLREKPDVCVIDGYVALSPTKKGLGAHLFDAIGGVAVVGIAKTEFRGASAARVIRGTSKKPLFVTAAGMRASDAARAVRSMHGAHRIPTLIARADRLCRES